jgi:hypothetical protein
MSSIDWQGSGEWKLKSRQIDSSHFEDKVQMRIDSLPKGQVNVLDLFSGQGPLWREVKARTGRNIRVTRVDKKPIVDVVQGDNLKIIQHLNLARYNVIDCDAYGDAYEQLHLLYENPTLGPATVVHYTYMRFGYGQVRYRMLLEIGIKKTMIRKCPSMFSALGYLAFLEFLYRHGVRRVHEVTIQENRRVYGFFTVAKKSKRAYTSKGAAHRKEP